MNSQEGLKYKKAYIEISNICNLQCSFCPEVIRPKNIISVQNFSNILKQVSPLVEQISLHLMGEPLAHPEFKKILEVCDEQGLKNPVKINLTTNGILLKKYENELINFKSLYQINFSLHSFRNNFKEKAIGDYLIPIIRWISELQSKRPEVYINLRMWNMPEVTVQHHNSKEILEFLTENYKSNFNFNEIDVRSKKSIKIQNRLYLNFDTEFEWPSLNNDFVSSKGTCYGLRSQFGVLSDGTVVPCCLDKEAGINLGNCLTQDLQGILKSSRAEAIKKGFECGQRVEKLCQHCSFSNRFD